MAINRKTLNTCGTKRVFPHMDVAAETSSYQKQPADDTIVYLDGSSKNSVRGVVLVGTKIFTYE